ncbi:MAG: PaaI family thioesterase [Chloroflexota bacterium]
MSQKDTSEKRRLITWQDHTPSVQAAQTMNGLDYLQSIAKGHLPAPPIGALLNMTLAEVTHGRVIFTIEPADYHYNPIGTVHGGVAATLLDSSTACAIHSTLAAGVGYTTVELKVNYIRPLTDKTGLVRCIGEVIHVGRRLATAEAKLIDANDKLYAHGTSTCMIFQPE